jgi:hypothetical protein
MHWYDSIKYIQQLGARWQLINKGDTYTLYAWWQSGTVIDAIHHRHVAEEFEPAGDVVLAAQGWHAEEFVAPTCVNTKDMINE